MNIETLKDFRLTLDDWSALASIHTGAALPSPIHVEMLILAGLVEIDNENPVLTVDGYNAAVEIDMIFDWEKFAHVESSESPPDASDEPKPADTLAEAFKAPQRLTVGSLVRHIPTGGVGLITKHTMYDADHGGFYVDFVKPVDNIIGGRAVNQLSKMFDRGDRFERV
tara:strand:- start:322 stop:825 length:504 start_codon:yes stop_codon:yes gene_type:complete